MASSIVAIRAIEQRRRSRPAPAIGQRSSRNRPKGRHFGRFCGVAIDWEMRKQSTCRPCGLSIRARRLGNPCARSGQAPSRASVAGRTADPFVLSLHPPHSFQVEPSVRMSIRTVPSGRTVTENSDLQFDRAQFDGSAPKPECAVCATPLYSSYFEVNGQTVCEGCCYKLREATPLGSRPGRVLRATAAGIGAGLAGTVLYWAILAATGYEFGLIAIVVGFAVGKAVNWGSRGRGGWAYQTLAMGLTYLAIVGAYVPMIVTEVMKQNPAAQTQAAPQDGAPVAADGVAADGVAADGVAADGAAADGAATRRDDGGSHGRRGQACGARSVSVRDRRLVVDCLRRAVPCGHPERHRHHHHRHRHVRSVEAEPACAARDHGTARALRAPRRDDRIVTTDR